MTGKTAPIRKRRVPRLPKSSTPLFETADLAYSPDIAGIMRLRSSVFCELLAPDFEKEDISLRLVGNSVDIYERRGGAVRAARSARGIVGSFVRYIDRFGFLSPSPVVTDAAAQAQVQLNNAIRKQAGSWQSSCYCLIASAQTSSDLREVAKSSLHKKSRPKWTAGQG
jgi:hypothetical protein